MFYHFCQKRIFPRLKKRIKKVAGLENIPREGAVILAANHIDRMDGPIIFILINSIVHRPVAFISRARAYNKILPHSAFPIFKLGKQEVLSRSLDHLQKGGVLVIFPEGQRNGTQELIRGKTGAARLALWTGAPIVPVGIKGPSISRYTLSLLDALIRKRKVEIKIGQPLYFHLKEGEKISYHKLQEVTREVMNNIALLSGKAYRW